MYFDLFLAATLLAAGSMAFGHFEEKTPLWRRLSKLVMYLGVTALLSWTVGRPWSLIWVLGFPVLGMTYHVWWCRKHGIGVLSGEPKDRFYELRDWK